MIATEIKTIEAYEAVFKDFNKAEALKYALDIRKFEIDLYWKRAAYFWSLIAATFAGFFALASTGDKTLATLMFPVSCIGLVLAVGWYAVNRGSKYWQENWERHVDALEEIEIGPLYKTTLKLTLFDFFKPLAGFRYSVSKINQIISLYIVFVWSGLFIHTIPKQVLPPNLESLKSSLIGMGPQILAILTSIFVFSILLFGLSGSQKKSRQIRFLRSHLGDKSDVKPKAD
ncbi:MAG: hypothetical protein RIE87_16700 [Rhodospirillales bacterium]